MAASVFSSPVARSGPLAKAFEGNVQRDVYDPVYLTTTQPSGDGVLEAGVIRDGHAYAPSRVLLFPYAEGPPGSVFSLRLYGWRSVKLTGTDQVAVEVWLYYCLAEFVCVTGDLPGPVATLNRAPATGVPHGFNLPVGPTEHLCQSLALTAGVLGGTGFVNSMPPGMNYPAFAGVELQGSQLVSLDLTTAGDEGGLAANCLWALA